MQHEAMKVTRKTWRRVAEMKLAWLYPTKVGVPKRVIVRDNKCR